MLNSNAEGLLCPQCKQSFGSIDDLLTHSESCAGEAQGFICPECKATFDDPESLVDHVEEAHREEGASGQTIKKIEREIDDLFGGTLRIGVKEEKDKAESEELPWMDELKKHELQFRRKQALIEFYKTRDPSKLDAVDNILTNYAFRDVVSSLKKTYGQVPPGWEKELGWFNTGPTSQAIALRNQRKQELVAFYRQHDPKKVGEVEMILESKKWTFKDVVASLDKKYGAVPAGDCRYN